MSAPSAPFRFVSTDRRVREDRRFVVGKGRFAADVALPGTRHVALVDLSLPGGAHRCHRQGRGARACPACITCSTAASLPPRPCR